MADHNKIKQSKRKLRHARVRSKVFGTLARPRLSVFRSAREIYAQLIDDSAGVTLAAARSGEIKAAGKKLEQAAAVGKLLAQKALKAGLGQVVFDRGAYKYHGRVKALAEAARAGGLQF